LAAILPKLELLVLEVRSLGEATGALHPPGARHYLIRFAVENSGYLPSYVSRRALERKTVRGVIVECFPLTTEARALTREDSATFAVRAKQTVLGAADPLGDELFDAQSRPYVRCMSGTQRLEGPSLEGHAAKQSLQAFLPDRALTAQRYLHQWQLAALPGTDLEVIARTERAGIIRRSIRLD